MNRTIVDMWVGIFVVAGLGAILLLALRVGNASATFNVSDTYSVYADFENIGGLKVRAPVKSAGVVVGLQVRLFGAKPKDATRYDEMEGIDE